MTTERKRIDELDFLKCVFIVLMIVFHLAYFGDMHPVAKKFVYTFHMPAFLFLAGYLANHIRQAVAPLRQLSAVARRALCRHGVGLYSHGVAAAHKGAY